MTVDAITNRTLLPVDAGGARDPADGPAAFRDELSQASAKRPDRRAGGVHGRRDEAGEHAREATDVREAPGAERNDPSGSAGSVADDVDQAGDQVDDDALIEREAESPSVDQPVVSNDGEGDEGDVEAGASTADQVQQVIAAIASALATSGSVQQATVVAAVGQGEPTGRRGGAVSDASATSVSNASSQVVVEAQSNSGASLVELAEPGQGQTATSGEALTSGQANGSGGSGQLQAAIGQAVDTGVLTVATVEANGAAAFDVGGGRQGPAGQAPLTLAQQSPAGGAIDAQEQANVARVVRGVSSAVQQGGGSVTLRLQPPELGFVRVALELNENGVRAVFTAEQPTARQLLTQQMTQLRQALESHGLHVERLTVQTMQPDDSSTNTQRQFDDGRSRGAFGQTPQQDDEDESGSDDAADERAAFEQVLNETV